MRKENWIAHDARRVHPVLLEPILREGVTKQQARLSELLRFPFAEVNNVHMPAETHRHGTAMPPAHASIVSRIRAVAGIIVRVRPKGRSLVGFPHDISRWVKDPEFVGIGPLPQETPPGDNDIIHDIGR